MHSYTCNYAFCRQFLNCNIHFVGTYFADVGRSRLRELIQNHCWEAYHAQQDIPTVRSGNGRDVARLCLGLRGGDVLVAKNSGSGVKMEAVGIVLHKATEILNDLGDVIGYRTPVQWVLDETRTIYDGGLGNLRITIGEGIHITDPVWTTEQHSELFEKYILRARARFMETITPGAIFTVNML